MRYREKRNIKKKRKKERKKFEKNWQKMEVKRKKKEKCLWKELCRKLKVMDADGKYGKTGIKKWEVRKRLVKMNGERVTGK